MKAKFAIGDKVKAVAFVDCFGIQQVERGNLTVTDVRLISPTTMQPYYRVTTIGQGECSMVEAAERFFEFEECACPMQWHYYHGNRCAEQV